MRVGVIAEIMSGIQPCVERRHDIARFSRIHEAEGRRVMTLQSREQLLIPSERIATFVGRKCNSGDVVERESNGQCDGGEHSLTIIPTPCECFLLEQPVTLGLLFRRRFTIADTRSRRSCAPSPKREIFASVVLSSSQAISRRFPISPKR